MPISKTRRIVLLADGQMNLLDLCSPLQTLTTANHSRNTNQAALYETIVASVDSGDEYYAPTELIAWIAQRAWSVRRLCAVCSGAFLLAAAGQLGGRRVAMYWDWVSRLKTRHPEIRINADKIFIRDGPARISVSVTAGIDLNLALIEADFSHQIALKIARQLVMFIKRSSRQSQSSVPLAAQSRANGKFADLHAWITAHLGGDLCVEKLAAPTNIAPRTFARAYAETCAHTRARPVEAMRLEAACRAPGETDLPLKSIAAKIGCAEEQNLRRVFQRLLGVSPTQYRQRFSEHVDVS